MVELQELAGLFDGLDAGNDHLRPADYHHAGLIQRRKHPPRLSRAYQARKQGGIALTHVVAGAAVVKLEVAAQRRGGEHGLSRELDSSVAQTNDITVHCMFIQFLRVRREI
ncbi:hypothetical protein RA210_U10442 [Rubrivivax sp. A210]|nr:hypothetical protein RA210_U10442 [Rubrivivax sp. A210]